MPTSREILAHARALGFSDGAILPVSSLDDESVSRYEHWLSLGYAAQMNYLGDHLPIRRDPSLLLEEACSMVVLTHNYLPSAQIPSKYPQVARYAYGRDYHKVLKKKLQQLLDFLRLDYPAIHGRGLVDSAPVMEKVWAARGGLGFIGRNTLLITPGRGSYQFIAILLVDQLLETSISEQEESKGCGDCRRCVDSCPNGAITEEGINANRCISYLTIEHKGEIPPEIRLANNLFGCDICQKVCPYNHQCDSTQESQFDRSPQRYSRSLAEWSLLSEEEFNCLTEGTPLRRAKYAGIRRNMEALLREHPINASNNE